MSYVIAVTQTKGGATKTTTSINLLGALLESGYKTILCDMDKDKPDAILWADLGDTLSHSVIPLYDENPKPKIDELRKSYDVILIDTPPSTQAAGLKGVMISDFIIIPCATSRLERNGLEQAASSAMLANKPYAFLASRTAHNTNSTKNLLDEITATGFYFKTNITHSTHMSDCQNFGQWIGEYKPNSIHHMQYRDLVKELIEKLQSE